MVKVRGKEQEPGFYAEAWNVRSYLATLMEELGEVEIMKALLNEPSDDYGEEYEALDKLNAVTEGGYWTIDQGLYLVEYDSELDKAFQLGA